MATAFAVFCATDGSLTFYNRDVIPTIDSEFEGKLVSKVYTGFDTEKYLNGVDVPWYNEALDILNVFFTPEFATVKPTSTALWFLNLRFTTFDSTNLNTSNVTNMSNMFFGCRNLTSLDLSNFNTSRVTDMTFMFGTCTSLKSIDLSSFDTSQTRSMSYMFYKCSSLKTIYVSELWSTSTIKDMLNGSDMFTDCNELVGTIPYDSSKTSFEYANYTTGYLKLLFTFKYHNDRFVITGSDLNRIAEVIRKKIGSIDGLSFPEGFITALESIGIVSSDDGSGNVIVNMTGTTVSHDNGNVVIS